MGLRRWVAAGVASLLISGAAGLAAPTAHSRAGVFQKCPGHVVFDGGQSFANHIRVHGMTCRKSKRVIKAPATDLGYTCDRVGDGGNVGRFVCTKPPKAVRFDYSTD